SRARLQQDLCARQHAAGCVLNGTAHTATATHTTAAAHTATAVRIASLGTVTTVHHARQVRLYAEPLDDRPGKTRCRICRSGIWRLRKVGGRQEQQDQQKPTESMSFPSACKTNHTALSGMVSCSLAG